MLYKISYTLAAQLYGLCRHAHNIYLSYLLLSAYSCLYALHCLRNLQRFPTLLVPPHATFLRLLVQLRGGSPSQHIFSATCVQKYKSKILSYSVSIYFGCAGALPIHVVGPWLLQLHISEGVEHFSIVQFSDFSQHERMGYLLNTHSHVLMVVYFELLPNFLWLPWTASASLFFFFISCIYRC